MREDVIIQYFKEMEEAIHKTGLEELVSFSKKEEARTRLDQLCRQRQDRDIDTAFGNIYYLGEDEKEIFIPFEQKGENLLQSAGLLDGYESIARNLFETDCAESHGIVRINDPKFIRDFYDRDILSEWGITIENNFDYLQSVKKITFRILAEYIEKLDLKEKKLDVFEALAEIELKGIAEEREKLLGQIEEVWKYVKERTEDQNLLGRVEEDLFEKAASEEDITLNNGKIRFFVPVRNAAYYRDLFKER